MISTKQVQRAKDAGLLDYFDMQAALGFTKHLGGWIATRELAQLCHLAPGDEILNVGSGTGVPSIRLATEFDCRVVGIDLLPAMVASAEDWAERKGETDRVIFRVADAQDLPFAEDRFDAVICESVNTFVPDLDRAAQEYVRVTKPGGYVGLSEAIWVTPPSEISEDILNSLTGRRIRTSDEWVDMLKSAGLSELVVRT